MNGPQEPWDEQLRAALIEQAGSIQAVTPWTPPAERRRSGRPLWRWLAPLAAAAAVVLIVIGAAVTRITAERDAHPASPTPPAPTVVIPTVVRTTPTVGPTTPASSRARAATTTTRTPTPVVPGPSTVTPARRTVTSAPAARTTAPGPTTTASSPSEKPSASPTITACMRQYTYESVTAQWSGVHGIQFSGLSELARCGGADDVNWFPTGHPFPLHLSAKTRIFVLRPGGQGDRKLPLVRFANYLSHPFTGLFVITGPKRNPTTLTEIYHP